MSMLLALMLAAGPIDEAVAKAPRTIWFIHVEDENGAVLYERNSGQLAIPASVRKLATAATVADCLGLEAQMRTELWRDGDDLILRGDGDPSFGSDVIGTFVEAVRARRIRRVRTIVADVSRFDRVLIPYQWKMGNLTSSYAAPVDALAYDENILPDEDPVASPALFAADRFREALAFAGIEVESIRVQYEPRQWPQIISAVPSPVLYDLLATVLKPSHNLYAEMLYKRASASGSYDESREIETFFLTSIGIDKGEFRFVDGSGLAPDDLVAPTAVVKILRWMNAPDRRGIWWGLLAIPGEQEGTLRRRLLPLADRLRAKTGSVAGVNALAGIVRGREGGFRYFAIAVNHNVQPGTVPLIDAIVTHIADF